MRSVSNIFFSIMMGILMVFVSVWYFIIYLFDLICDLIEQGTQKLKKYRNIKAEKIASLLIEASSDKYEDGTYVIEFDEIKKI